ncbi:cyclase family protein [Patescibacteria group bacterium]|nr:cyclase family protein [Patescibacteria group bacterium]
MKIIDISLTLHPGLVVWQGDQKIELATESTVEKDKIMDSRLSLGAHNGTHIDAPAHFIKDGFGVDKIEPQKLIGGCTIIQIDSDTITANVLHGKNFESRVLFKTKNSERKLLDDPNFHTDYVYLTEDGVEYLIEKGVILVGTDYLGIEKKSAPGHPVHTKLLEKEIVIVEGLNLVDVQPGNYELIVLPLKLKDLDGSPARAVLIKK